ncbi:FAD-binding oxidoreductase [Falsiroseomonas sp. HW251]|uniref:FAD-binding oxidoreductase n=1 Tax=Falsiroseomonas sp. HW251 TaxID=3390998 RepID=UPI003D312599
MPDTNFQQASLQVATPNGTATVSADALAALRNRLRGALMLPGDPGYDTSRRIWNAMIDRRPAMIIRCAGAADVIEGVRFARDQGGLLLAVRGGGHNIAGSAVCEGGVMLDLSAMRSVRVDPVGRTARVEPGALLSDFDREAQAFGLATPLGINSTTGVAGLTLGGGFGWLTRKHGTTVDNLLSADVVTADGKLVHASADRNPELFWAIRGGGGNFGVVTSFEFRLHPVGPEVLSGLIVHPLEDAAVLLRQYREIVAKAPEELTCWVVLRKAPPLPFLPPEWHGREVLVFALCYAGDMAEGRRATAPIEALGKPIANVVGPHPFAAWQAAFDPLLTDGARNYWKSHDFAALSDGMISTVLDHAARLPSPQSEIFIAHLGGAANRVPVEATAYAHRGAAFTMNVHTRWETAAEDEACIAWARGFSTATAPFATGSVYVNFLGEDEAGRVQAAYGPNYGRLAQLKAKYDPTNLFRANQNIRPMGRAMALIVAGLFALGVAACTPATTSQGGADFGSYNSASGNS